MAERSRSRGPDSTPIDPEVLGAQTAAGLSLLWDKVPSIEKDENVLQ